MAREFRILLVLGALLLASIALAADKPRDFSGTWTLDKVERSFSPAMSEGGSSLPSGDGRPGGGAISVPGIEGGYPGGGGGGYPGGGGGGGRRGGGFPGGGGRRGTSSPGPGAGEDGQAFTLTISQTPTEVKMARKRNPGTDQPPVIQIFTLDGKENVNPDERGRGEYKSKSKWHKESLVIDGNLDASGGGRSSEVHVKQELSLSKDGQILTVKTSRTTTQGTVSLKQTFKKQ